MEAFINNTRLQSAAICFLVIILVNYVRMEKPPQLSTKYFNGLMTFSAINMIFDIATVFTISHPDIVSPFINRLFHQIFIMTLNILVVCFYLYVSALGNKQQRFSKPQMLIRMLPLIISFFVVVFGPIYYYNDGKNIYSYGLAPYTIYGTIILYMLLIFIDTFRYKNVIKRNKIVAIRLAMSIWIIAAAIQFFFPAILLSGLASVLLVFFLYLSFENPREYIDEKAGCFNLKAYNMMLVEYFAANKRFYIVNIVIKDTTALYNALGQDNGARMIADIASELKTMLDGRIYHTRGSMLTVAFPIWDNVNEKVDKIKKFFEEPKKINQTEFFLKVLISVIECPKYAKDADAVFDVANYVAKYGGKEVNDDNVIFVNDEIIDRIKNNSKIQGIVSDAIENDGFDVVYQPIYDVKSGKFSSAEALVRLKDTQTVGYISPEVFITIAEKQGMIMDIGEIVFKKVCKFGKDNSLKEKGIHYIEVNLSGIQAVDMHITEQIKKILGDYDTSPDFINLEITETASVDYKNILRRNMTMLRKLGCSFSMDDFGTGYSNLSQMADVQYDLIKLDKSLIWPCFDKGAEKKARIILETIVSLVKKIDVKIVAEGVETEEQVNYLRELGIDYIQGYYFSKPLRENDYLEFIEKAK